MRISYLYVTTSLICIAGIASPVMAETGFASSTPNSAPPSSYASSSDAPPSSYPSPGDAPPSSYPSPGNAPPSSVSHNRRKHDRFSVSVNIPGTNTVVSYREPKHGGKHHRQQQPFWVPMSSGEPLPTNAVIGGNEYQPQTTFYVCRSNYRGGVHPGKYFAGHCNISWGGRELVMSRFEVLVSDISLGWVSGSYGSIPNHAIPGGSEQHRAVYICQAEYENGTHTGKLIGNNCNFGWGGREMMIPFYNVLVG